MIPPLRDDDGTIREAIDALRPVHDADESPRGRLTGIDADTWTTYAEMYDLLRCPPEADPSPWEQRLQDLATTLLDLHHKADAAFAELMEAHHG